MNYSTEVKQKLLSIITKMDSYYWLFTKHPKTDFSRKKKWSFEEVMKFMLTMEGKALRDELLEYFEFDNTTPSNSSFNQRRAQILPEAFEFLFQEFTKSFTDNVTYNGLRPRNIDMWRKKLDRPSILMDSYSIRWCLMIL